MNPLERFAERIERLEAVAAIHALKARYAELADAKYSADHQRQSPEELSRIAWEQSLCFSPDAIWIGGEFGGDLRGHEQLYRWFLESPWRFAKHLYGSPVIEVAGDRATGRWRLWQMALREDTGKALLLFGTTRETYRRNTDGHWLIDSMAFEDIHLMPAGMPLVHRLTELA